MNVRYFDNAATTRVKDEVLEEMLPYLKEKFGNPSSMYTIGREAKKAIENARERVAKLINCKANEIYFTGSGSESDNTAIKGIAHKRAFKGKHIITSKIEHPAVLHTCQSLEREGFKVTYLNVNKDGIVKLHTNLGAAYILQSKYVPAKEELEQAYALYQKFKVSLMTHKPLIYNLLFIYNILGDTSKRDKLFEEAYFDNLSSYYNQLISGSENILTDGYWPLQFKHVFFNY